MEITNDEYKMINRILEITHLEDAFICQDDPDGNSAFSDLPQRGGFTVGDHPSRSVSENSQISHRWLNPSIPRRARSFRYSGSKTILDSRLSVIPPCLGIPNFSL